MALARVKTWIAGDLLTALDLNNEFNNVLNNPVSLVSPTTGAINFALLSHTNLVPTALSATSGSTGQVLTITGGVPVWGNVNTPTVQIFTAASTTWTRPTGVTKVHVVVVAGGGGAGATSTTNGANGSAAGGGGGGGTATGFLTLTSTMSSATITIGAGGAGGTGPGISGSSGASSVWSDGTNTITAIGGSGGQNCSEIPLGFQDASPAAGGSGTAGSGGIVHKGDGGGFGIILVPSAYVLGGFGGGSAICGQTNALYAASTALSAPANSGGGGAAGSNTINMASKAGGAGGSGRVIVTEYY